MISESVHEGPGGFPGAAPSLLFRVTGWVAVMLKEVLASNTAKLVAACVCPAVGATAVALKVPQVRAAVHKATAPKPERTARAKPRVLEPKKPDNIDDRQLAMRDAALCPPPVMLQNASIEPRTATALQLAPAPVIERERIVYLNSGPCTGTGVITIGGHAVGAVPEPATWAQMIAGFALMGATIRAGRRRQQRRLA